MSFFSIAQPTFSFSQLPDEAPRNITVACKEQDLSSGQLPKWIWYATDVNGNIQPFTEKAVPGCIDPTYCEKNPPVPSFDGIPVDRDSSAGVVYTKPKKGSLRYLDGEIVLYKCNNDSK